MENSITDAISESTSIEEEKFTVEAKTSRELIYTPDQGLVALATSIAIVGACFYLALRYKPSRGLSVLISTVAATVVAYGLIVATRAGTTAVTALAMPIVAISIMIVSLFYLSTEKAMLKDVHEELTVEKRKEVMVKALGKSASPMLVFLLIVVYIAINFFGFGLAQTAFLFGSALVGEIVGAVALLTISGPLAVSFGKAFGKIKLPKFKSLEHKEKEVVAKKRNSSEPEETTFIGIND